MSALKSFCFHFPSLRSLSNLHDENRSFLAEAFSTVRNFGLHGEAPHIHMQFIPRNGVPSRRGSVSSFNSATVMDARHNSSWHSFAPFGRKDHCSRGANWADDGTRDKIHGWECSHTQATIINCPILIILSRSQSFLQPGRENAKGICIFIYC